MNRKRKFSKEEDLVILRMGKQSSNKSACFQAISEELYRTPCSIRNRYYRLTKVAMVTYATKEKLSMWERLTAAWAKMYKSWLHKK